MKPSGGLIVIMLGCLLLIACDSRESPQAGEPTPDQPAGPASRPTPARADDLAVAVPDLSGITPADLPEIGGLEAFRTDQSGARALCRALRIPELPDISQIDADGQQQFYTMFNRLRNAPRDADQYGLLGQLYSAQRFADLSVQLLERAIAMDRVDYQWHYSLALRLEKNGDLERADAAYRTATQLNPEYPPVWMRLTWRSVADNDSRGALENIDRYIALRPEDPVGYVERAQIHYDESRWEDMQDDLDKAMSLGEVGKKGHRLLGALYSHLGMEQERDFHLQSSRADPPGGEMDDPLEHLVRRLETFRNPEVTTFFGLITNGRHTEALEMRDIVLDKTKDTRDHGTALGLIAECYRKLHKYQQAYEYAMRAAGEMPDEPAPYVEIALALVHGNPEALDAAMLAADKAVALDPDLDTARYARGLILLQYVTKLRDVPPTEQPAPDQHPLPAAVKDLEKCITLKPVDLNYLVALATAYAMQGRFDKADPLVDNALRISPDDPKIQNLRQKVDRHEAP